MSPPPRPGQLGWLPVEKIPEAAALTAQAFAPKVDASMWTVICGAQSTEQGRHRLLRWLFERNLTLRQPTGCNRCVILGDGRIACSLMFVTPHVGKASLLQMCANGLLAAPFLFGLAPVRRLMAAQRHYEDTMSSICDEHLQGMPYCRLERVAVAPALQGRGIGTDAMRQALAEADAAGWPCMLATQNVRHVAKYAKLGFAVVRTQTGNIDSVPVTSMFMLRQPARAQAGDRAAEALPTPRTRSRHRSEHTKGE